MKFYCRTITVKLPTEQGQSKYMFYYYNSLFNHKKPQNLKIKSSKPWKLNFVDIKTKNKSVIFSWTIFEVMEFKRAAHLKEFCFLYIYFIKNILTVCYQPTTFSIHTTWRISFINCLIKELIRNNTKRLKCNLYQCKLYNNKKKTRI